MSEGASNPKSLDYIASLDKVPDGYRAMNDRKVLKC